MLKRIQQIIGICMFSSVGVFLGHSLFLWLDYRKHPDLYAMVSFPWYKGILVYGEVAAVILLVCGILYAMLHHIEKKRGQ